MSRDAFDAVICVEVLHKRNLEARSGTLARSDGRIGEEILPDAEPALAVLGRDLVLIGDPVAVPSPKGRRVVDANGVDHLDLEAGALELVDDPAKGAGCVSAGEDVLVHEETPGEILELPGLAKTGDLEEEDAVVVEHVVDLAEEGAEVSDANVFSHFETGNLVVAAGGDRDIAVVHAQDVGLFLTDTCFPEAAVAPGGLVTPKGDAGNMCTVFGRSELGQGAPATADIEHPLALLQTDLLANNSHLVVLELLERLLAVDIGDDARGIDHSRAEEPAVEVVAAVIVVAHLLFVWFIVSLRSS